MVYFYFRVPEGWGLGCRRTQAVNALCTLALIGALSSGRGLVFFFLSGVHVLVGVGVISSTAQAAAVQPMQYLAELGSELSYCTSRTSVSVGQ